MGKNRKFALGSALVIGAVMMTVSPVGSAPPTTEITNGDFETDAVGSDVVTGWSSTLGQVDLGVTSLGGCVATDGSDYSTLRGYPSAVPRPTLNKFGAGHPNISDVFVVEPSGGGAQVQVGGVDVWYEDEFLSEYMKGSASATSLDELIPYSEWSLADQTAFDAAHPYEAASVDADDESVSFVDSWVLVVDEATAQSGSLGRTGKVLELFSETDGGEEVDGYVAHGPAVVSDPFTVEGALSIYLDWMASGDEDDYHVYGYLLNTATCAKTTVINSTGESHAWSTIEVPVAAAGTYRFVFVSGTYDQSWGGAGGALLYIDNVELAPTSGAAPAIPATGAESTRVLIVLAGAALAGGLVLVRRSRLA